MLFFIIFFISLATITTGTFCYINNNNKKIKAEEQRKIREEKQEIFLASIKRPPAMQRSPEELERDINQHIAEVEERLAQKKREKLNPKPVELEKTIYGDLEDDDELTPGI